MARIGITGSDGFLGWHLRAFLHSIPDIHVVPGARNIFSSNGNLDEFVQSSDVIVHLAGMNRGPDEELAHTNIRLTEQLIDTCKRLGRHPHVLFSSSLHIHRTTAYGQSKRFCAEKLGEWAAKSGGKFTNLILPNVFGEGGLPFYNSVVATFCYQMARDERPDIHEDRLLQLIHAQEVAVEIWMAVKEGQGGEISPAGTTVSVSGLLERLASFSDNYKNRQSIIPQFESSFELQLFNTLRSYLYPGKYPVTVDVHQDARGGLYEAVKTFPGGQAFLSSTHPGITRGNHYHHRKIERFLVVKGQAKIKIRKLFTDEVFSFALDGNRPQFIDIPTFHTHCMTNTGDKDLLTLFWSNEFFDPEDSDTYREMVDVR